MHGIMIALVAVPIMLGTVYLLGGPSKVRVVVEEPFMHEDDPRWVPRVPNSTNRPVLVGQCGQYHGPQAWHRIECPKTKEQ